MSFPPHTYFIQEISAPANSDCGVEYAGRNKIRLFSNFLSYKPKNCKMSPTVSYSENSQVNGIALVAEEVNGPFQLVDTSFRIDDLADDEVLVKFEATGIW